MRSQYRFLVYLVCVALLALFASFRVSWEEEKKIPRAEQISVLFKVRKEPKLTNNFQIIELGDARVFADLFPRYRVGDKLEVVGAVDAEGRLFRAKITKLARDEDLFFMLSALRNRIAENIYSMLPANEATLVVGSVLGVDNIGAKFRDELIKTGTIHVVVVSGQNLMIVAGVFIACAKFIGRRPSLILATAAVLFYALLSGFEPPVIRASLMVLASSAAIFFGRESSALINLLVAACLIVFIWPFALFEVSFQLTFAATLGIITFGQKLNKLFSQIPIIGENAAVATSAYIFTAPIILFHFGEVSAFGPIANLMVAEAVFPIMILGFTVSIFSLISAPLAQIFAYFAYVPAFYFVQIVGFFAKLA